MRVEKYYPLGDRVLVQVEQAKEKSEGGIFIPDSAKGEKYRGEVLGYGTETKYVEVGDKVIFGKYSGSNVDDDDETLLVINEDDILCIINREPNCRIEYSEGYDV